MASISQLSALLQKMEEINSTDTKLIKALSELDVVQCKIQDIPQFQRGEALPTLITPTPTKLSPSRVLDLCVRPQMAYSYNINMPKRFEGVIQFQAEPEDYEAIIEIADSSWKQRKELQKHLIEVESNERKRGKLTKQLYPGILFQTLRRRAPIAPYNTLGITTSWCDEQKGLKKIGPDEALALIKTVNSSVPDWQARRNQERIESAPNIYKKTEIRVHPISVLRYINEHGKVKCDPKKVHSPIIVLSESTDPIQYSKLEELDRSIKVEHSIMKGYKPLVDNTCLFYRK
jgi:hypothetical protein